MVCVGICVPLPPCFDPIIEDADLYGASKNQIHKSCCACLSSTFTDARCVEGYAPVNCSYTQSLNVGHASEATECTQRRDSSRALITERDSHNIRLLLYDTTTITPMVDRTTSSGSNYGLWMCSHNLYRSADVGLARIVRGTINHVRCTINVL